ncbi:MAG: thioredoxin-disulfide reductase [Holosporaceae bacterium]|jgi:thioredoxin reductase (NADPH)|nr:thioredoxin-disulfide reductase [Holosporaceae bacterium]
MADPGIVDILIIGSGPAGYSASIYAARAGRSTLVILGPQPGGQLIITSFIENYPGFVDPISGPILMDQMSKQAEKMGVTMVNDVIRSVDFSSRPFVCYGESGIRYESKAIIIATGATAKWLGIPGEVRYRGAGVSACATCDGFFFRDKKVAVIGGGNTAVEEALYLTKFAESVMLIHRRNELRAEKIMQIRLSANPKIELLWNTKVVDILGNGSKVTELLLERDGEEVRRAVDGVFIAIGHQPATTIFDGQLLINAGGYVIVDGVSSRTSVPGVFAAGDVRNSDYRQAIVSAGQGCIAAIDADGFLSNF